MTTTKTPSMTPKTAIVSVIRGIGVRTSSATRKTPTIKAIREAIAAEKRRYDAWKAEEAEARADARGSK